MHELVHDLSDRVAIGAAVFEDLHRPAIQPVSQFLDGLHVAACSLFDVRPSGAASSGLRLRSYRRARGAELRDRSYRAADHGGFWVRSCGPFWLVNPLVSREIGHA